MLNACIAIIILQKNEWYGFMIGDGKLVNYRPECIAECYYLIIVTEHAFITPNYQFVINPAYNMDRGPVHVFSMRLHFEF